MKESKFIELLNLYVDHQISPADAALLEAEIQKRPERRKIYREYCQMQKACMTLAENFRSEAPVGGKVFETYAEEPRRMAFITYAMGFAAAAACIALVVVKRPIMQPERVTSPQVAVAPVSTASAEPESVAVTLPAVDKSRPALHSVFPGLVRRQSSADTAVATAEHPGLEWMNQVQLQRVTAEDLWFTTRPAIQSHDLMLRSAKPSQGQVETTAFIFAK